MRNASAPGLDKRQTSTLNRRELMVLAANSTGKAAGLPTGNGTREPYGSRVLEESNSKERFRDYLVPVAAIFFTMASTNLRSLSFRPDE